MHLGCQKVYAKIQLLSTKCIEIVYSFLEKRKVIFSNKFCFFARLIVPLTFAEGTSAWKSSNKFGISLA